MGLPDGMAISSFFPTWETQTPQYPAPAIYPTAQAGFLQNEFAYSIIVTRALAQAQAPLWVYDNSGEYPEEIDDHPLRKLIEAPNQNMDESMFWQITRIVQDIAGFCAWEVESNKIGEPIRLWLMRPDWCSFIRGQQQPMAYIRYQPWGLEPADVPISRVLFFTAGEDFHPLYPGIKFFSPLMHALPILKVDNAMTFFLGDFVEHGAKPAGIVSVTNTMTDTIAEDYRKRWQQQHGGVAHWHEPLFLGLGSKYENVQMNFKDMAFGELDARAELRICRAFNIDPIVADAHAGLDVSSYNNKEQAEKGWFQKWVMPTWRSTAGAVTRQLLTKFDGDETSNYCEFYTADVYSLVEDRTEKVNRAVSLFEKMIATRNEAREEVDLDPLEGPEGKEFYTPTKNTIKQPVNAEGDIEGAVDGEDNTPMDEAVDPTKDGAEPADELPAEQDSPELAAAKDDERAKYKRFAQKRIKEGKMADLDRYEFKFLTPAEQMELMLRVSTQPIAEALDKILLK